MIKYLVTDLDGTLFEGHGDSVFDLAQENVYGLNKAKEHGLVVIPCTGRSIPYSLRLYKLFDLNEHIIAGGLNGGLIYDNEMVKELTLDSNDVLDMIKLVEEYPNTFINMQAQDLWNKRVYYNPNAHPAPFYREECLKDHCSEVCDETIKEYIEVGNVVAKFAISSETVEDSNFLEGILKCKYAEKYTITRSNPRFLEVNHKEAHKGNFVKYIKDRFGLNSDEVAVIGDNFNDSYMYLESFHTFAMANGEQALKAQAKYVVSSVGECIDMIIDELNSKGDI